MFRPYNVEGEHAGSSSAMKNGQDKRLCNTHGDLHTFIHFNRALRHAAHYASAIMTWKKLAKNKRHIHLFVGSQPSAEDFRPF